MEGCISPHYLSLTIMYSPDCLDQKVNGIDRMGEDSLALPLRASNTVRVVKIICVYFMYMYILLDT